jgi:hypothetical protein
LRRAGRPASNSGQAAAATRELYIELLEAFAADRAKNTT